MSNTSMKQLNLFLNENKKDIKTLTSNLGISILIIIVLIEFFNKITNNFSLILKNYVDENRLIYGSEKTDKLENENENNFEDIVNYKKKYNLDSDINSKIDRKVLNGDNDNYEYKNQPNFIDFILDIFKPTKA